MKYLMLFFLFLSSSYALNVKAQMFELYKQSSYEQSCQLGFKNLASFTDDEEFLTVYGLSCIEADYIDRLAVPISLLKWSDVSRANASYFTTILFQKKLLYQALKDDYNLKSIIFPTTDYVLSKVFNLYQAAQVLKKREYIFNDPQDTSLKYKLYLQADPRIDKMVIEEIKNGTIIKKHIYW